MKGNGKRILSIFLAGVIAVTTVGYAPPFTASASWKTNMEKALELLASPSDASRATPSEAENPGREATPSEAEIPDGKATPSQAVKKFVRVEPEEIPEYYSQVSASGKKFWKFEDRNGMVQYRDYGYVQGDAEFPLWYLTDLTGTVDGTYVSVNLDEEYYSEAPYIYSSVAPDQTAWTNLSWRLFFGSDEIDGYTKKKIGGFKNWDPSGYYIWHLVSKDDEDNDQGFHFYGHIKNSDNKGNDIEDKWYYSDSEGKIINVNNMLGASLMATTYYDFEWYLDAPGQFRLSIPSNQYLIKDHPSMGGSTMYPQKPFQAAIDRGMNFTSKFVAWASSRSNDNSFSVPRYNASNAVIGYDYLNGDPANIDSYYSGVTLLSQGFIFKTNEWYPSSIYGVWCPDNADIYIFAREGEDRVNKKIEYFNVGNYTYAIQNIKVRRNSSFNIDSISTPTKSGYTFEGWRLGSGYGDYIASGTEINCGSSGRVTWVFPSFKPIENTVTFLDIDGGVLSSQKVNTGESATAPEAPKIVGKLFKGWDKTFTNISSDLVVKPIYVDSVIVTILGNGGTVYGEGVYTTEIPKDMYSSTLLEEIIKETKRTGYVTSKYMCKIVDANGVASDVSTKLTEDITITVNWSLESFYVTYYTNYPQGDTATSNSKRLNYGDALGDTPGNVSSIGKGLRLKGWYLNSYGSGEKIDSSSIMTSGVKLYAQWESFDVTYRLHYDLDREKISESRVIRSNVSEEDLVKKLPTSSYKPLTFPGYLNNYWTDSNGTILYSPIKYPTEEIVDLYWKRTLKNIDSRLFYPSKYSSSYDASWEPFRGYGYTKYGEIIKEESLYKVMSYVNGLSYPNKVFKGFYTDSSGTTPIDFSKPLTPTDNSSNSTIDFSVYALFTNESSELTFKDYDGSVISKETVNYNSEIVYPEDPKRAGYVFTGWDKNLGSISKLEKDTTVTAQYIIEVGKLTLDANGGTLDGTNTSLVSDILYGELFDDLLYTYKYKVKRPGYTFDGWYTMPTGGSEYTGSGNTMPASSVTVYAHWVRNSSEVVYKDWNGDVLKTQEVGIGADATPPSDPVRAGYAFTGWDKPSTNIQNHTTITAQYTANRFTLTLDGNGGTISGDETKSQMISFGESIDQVLSDGAAKASRKYYTFDGWYTMPIGGSKYTGSGNTMQGSSVTVYAHWVRNSSEVVYKDWNGDVLKTQEVGIGADATPPSDPVRAGYAFTGWDKLSTNIQNHTTITAQYTANRFTLTLDGNGGNIAGDETKSQTISFGESMDQVLEDGAAKASRKYYTFDGWYTLPSGGSKYTGSGNTMPVFSVTVYAHWVRNSSEVVYKDWDGNVIKTQEVGIGADATPPSDPVRAGFAFAGWDKPSTNIQNHTTITAQYTANRFTLTLDGNGGNIAGDETKSQTISFGESMDQVLEDGAAKASRKYYTFDGWYTMPTGGSKYTGSGNTMPAFSVTVYAHWVRNSSEVVYKDWNGDVLITQEVAIGADATPPEDPVRTGYTFIGWDKQFKNIQSNTTITAVYTADNYKQTSEEKNNVAPVPVPPTIDTTTKPTVPDSGGKFIVNPENPYDVTYTKPDGTLAKDEWVGDGRDWYHVDEKGKINYDWYLEGEKTWYKFNKEKGDRLGAALIGWNHEPMDDKRYFFDPTTTKMLTGWQNIDGKSYYFTTNNEGQTYFGSNLQGGSGWKYDPNRPGKPYGSMYRNEYTPDGYWVDENGVCADKK
ncbi:InlB B-repeat-containing protein [Lacrimispora sp.]|uniref:InlB B-repeat-containing protein n=1 Tax=Lacrimispora sp. TaxID=2719234 RepID=UPI0028AFF24D|nr:InlB B-repeat-containing protein [Lacrimispora sp.]